jgi:hypothetical protein
VWRGDFAQTEGSGATAACIHFPGGKSRPAITFPPSERSFSIRRLDVVAFLLSMVLFIGVCGFLDTRLLWPTRPTRGGK